MEYDIHNTTLEAVALEPAIISSNTTTVGEAIDTEGFNALEYIVSAGVLVNGTFTAVLEEADDLAFTVPTTVPTELTLGSAVLSAVGVSRIGTIGKKRFQRLTIVSTATTTGGIIGGVAILQHARYNPTANNG